MNEQEAKRSTRAGETEETAIRSSIECSKSGVNGRVNFATDFCGTGHTFGCLRCACTWVRVGGGGVCDHGE